MSNPSPWTPEAEAHANDADTVRQVEYLEQNLEVLDLSDHQPSTASQEPRKKKLSAVRSNEALQTTSSSQFLYVQRDLLKKLNKRRLEVTRIDFTAGDTQASRGGYGEVVAATLTVDDSTSSDSANRVAVKKFLFGEDIDEEKFLRTFANELHVLDGLDHLNIIKIVGFVEDIKGRIAWLVFPWEANGNVRDFLRSGKWELPERVSLIKDVADGLEYLHTRQPPIRHGDLKSLNILVSSKHRAVITDFGEARIQTEGRGFETTGSPHRQAASTKSEETLYDGCPEITVSTANAELTLTGPGWSFRWAAPEVLNEEDQCLESDIWALGWIAWEIVTDNYPFPEARTNALITIKVIAGLLPSLSDDVQLSQIGQLCDVMVRCWKSKPKERLSAAQCRRAIELLPYLIPRFRSDATTRSAALLVRMGEMHRMQGGYREALKLFDEACSIARSAGLKSTMAEALYLAADTHRLLSNYGEAEESCNQALAICTDTGDGLVRAGALFELGLIYKSQPNYAKAEESYNEALAMYTRLGNSLGRANAFQELGTIHEARSNYPKAEESYHQALAIYTNLGHSLGRGGLLRRLGDIHQAQSNHAEAEESFNQALAISTTVGDRLGRANALLKLGKMHQARSNHGRAEEFFRQALDILTSIGKSREQTQALLGLGEVLLHQARYSEAKSFLQDAAEISNRIKYNWGQNRSRALLAEVLEAEKSFTELPP